MNEKKARESLRLLRSPFYRNSKREKQEKLEQLNEAFHQINKLKEQNGKDNH